MSERMGTYPFKMEPWKHDEAKRLGLNVSKICRDAVTASIFFTQSMDGMLAQKALELKEQISTLQQSLDVIEDQMDLRRQRAAEMEMRVQNVAKHMNRTIGRVSETITIDDDMEHVKFRMHYPGDDLVPDYFYNLVHMIGDRKAVIEFIQEWKNREELPSEEEIENWIRKELESNEEED